MGEIELESHGSWQSEANFKVLVSATVPLSSYPDLDGERAIFVPVEARRAGEIAIRLYAGLWSLSGNTSRQLSSPIPSVAFIPETDADRDWLRSTSGIRIPGALIQSVTSPPEFSGELAQGMLDRLAGLELFAEAMAHPRDSAKFRDFVRMFELAFGIWKMKPLRQALTAFLEPSPFGYTDSEIAKWLDHTRHGLAHANVRGEILLEEDVVPVIARVHDAAIDVLTNKAEWGTNSKARRQLWQPVSGTRSPSGDVFIVQGATPKHALRVVDGLSGIPIDLSAGIRELPAGWWSENAGALDAAYRAEAV